MAGRVQDKVVLITGGGTGIGAATARALGREGAHVVICGRRPQPLAEVVESVQRRGGSAEAHSVDVSDEAAYKNLIHTTAERHGRLDGLVNNAFHMVAAPLDQLSTEDWHASFRVTLDAAFFALRTALPLMAEQHTGGSIVNVSSTAGHAGQFALAGYASAKAALENLTRTAAVEGAPGGVRVNAVAPGVIATEGTEAAFAEPAARRRMEGMIPLGRFGRPEEVAYGILYLISDEASFVTGACLVIDGGQRASLGAPLSAERLEVD